MGIRGVIPDLYGAYGVVHERNGEILQAGVIENTVLDDGFLAGLNVLFFGGTQTQDWYLAWSHVGSPGGQTRLNSEFTGFSQSTRPKWHSSVVSVGDHRSHETFASTYACRVDATTFAVWTCTETAYLACPILTTESAKNAAGTIWSRGDLGGGGQGIETARVRDGGTLTLHRGNVVVWPGDQLKVNYAVMDFGENFAATALTGTKLFLDCLFKGATVPSTFFVGLISGTAELGTAYQLYDTMASHSGWSEFTSYLGSRPALTNPRSLTSLYQDNTGLNPAFLETESANYRITGVGTVGGYFITTSNNKGGSDGILYSGFQIDNQRGFVDDFVSQPLWSVGDATNFPYFPIRLFKGEFLRLRLTRSADED